MELARTQTEPDRDASLADAPAVPYSSALVEENSRLSDRVRDLEQQLAQQKQRAQATIQHISSSFSHLSHALRIVSTDASINGLPLGGDAPSGFLDDLAGVGPHMNDPVEHLTNHDILFSDLGVQNMNFDAHDDLAMAETSAFVPAMPGLSPFGQMASELLNTGRVPPVPRPSIYCLPILRFEGSVRHSLIQQYSDPSENPPSLDLLIRKMFHALANTEQFSADKLWYTETCTFHFVGPITRWRILPTQENYDKLAPAWRPTETQLTTFHWPAIDWLPYPELRDKMIRHAHEYDLTEFLQTSMQSYCLEVEIGDRTERASQVRRYHDLHFDARPSQLSGSDATHVYYRLSEFLSYLSQKDDGERENGAGRMTLPPGLEALFLFALQDVTTPFKLERSIFLKYPFLSSEDAIVRGVYLPLDATWDQPYPDGERAGNG